MEEVMVSQLIEFYPLKFLGLQMTLAKASVFCYACAMSHLSDIGFPIDNEEDYKQLFAKFAEKAVVTRFHRFRQYLIEDEKSGAQMYWYFKMGSLWQENVYIGMTPGFKHTKAFQNVREVYFHRTKGYSIEPGLYLWIENKNGEEYPLYVDMPDYFSTENIDSRSIKVIAATLFADNFEYFESEAEFWEKYPKEDGKAAVPAPGMFIPTGTFSPQDDPNSQLQALCWCYGKIKEFEKLQNGLTKRYFYHFVLSTYAADYDVVVNENDVKKEPKVGAIIGGEFWISAQIIATGKNPLENQQHPISTLGLWMIVGLSSIILFGSILLFYLSQTTNEYLLIITLFVAVVAYFLNKMEKKYIPEMALRKEQIKIFANSTIVKYILVMLAVLGILALVIYIWK